MEDLVDRTACASRRVPLDCLSRSPKEPPVFVIGLSFRSAPLTILEWSSVPQNGVPAILRSLRRSSIFKERVFLSTCNRTELYGTGEDHSLEEARLFLAEHTGLGPDRLDEVAYTLSGRRAVEHLFSVASGLDSMVFGETEISGQVKQFYSLARESGHTGKTLNRLFERALKVTKELRSTTGIGSGKVSFGTLSADLAEKGLGRLLGKKVVVVGTGKIARLTLKSLVERGACPLIVSSRHVDRASLLAREFNGKPYAFECLEELALDADVLIASTSCPNILIRKSDVMRWLRTRKAKKPFILIDLGIPRNIDSTVGSLAGVSLYNLEDLSRFSEKNLSARESERTACARLIRAQAERYSEWWTREFKVFPRRVPESGCSC